MIFQIIVIRPELMRWIYIGFIFFLLGCSSSPSPVLPPAELQSFEKTVDVITKWNTDIGTGAYDHYLKFPPVFFNDVGYVADHMGMIRAFNTSTGETIWDKQLDVQISAGPSIAEGLLLIGTHTGDVIALTPEKGDNVWRSKVSSEVLARPIGGQGFIIVRTVDGNLFSLNAATGAQRWVYERTVPLLTLRGNSLPVIVDDMVLLGADNGKLTALTLNDGTELWEVAISIPAGRTELERIIDIDADPVVVDDIIYIVTYQGRLAAVQLQNGHLLWVRDMSSYSGMAVDSYRIYLTDTEGQVLAMNRMSGATIWRQDKLLRRSLTRPALHGDYIVVADYEGYVHWLNREDGRISERKSLYGKRYIFEETNDVIYYEAQKTNILAEPVVYNDMLFATDRFGVMTAFNFHQE